MKYLHDTEKFDTLVLILTKWYGAPLSVAT